MDEKQVQEYVAPVKEQINSDPNEKEKEMIMSQDSNNPEDVAPVEEVSY